MNICFAPICRNDKEKRTRTIQHQMPTRSMHANQTPGHFLLLSCLIILQLTQILTSSGMHLNPPSTNRNNRSHPRRHQDWFDGSGIDITDLLDCKIITLCLWPKIALLHRRSRTNSNSYARKDLVRQPNIRNATAVHLQKN